MKSLINMLMDNISFNILFVVIEDTRLIKKISDMLEILPDESVSLPLLLLINF